VRVKFVLFEVVCISTTLNYFFKNYNNLIKFIFQHTKYIYFLNHIKSLLKNNFYFSNEVVTRHDFNWEEFFFLFILLVRLYSTLFFLREVIISGNTSVRSIIFVVLAEIVFGNFILSCTISPIKSCSILHNFTIP